jgi:hypothetical protein
MLTIIEVYKINIGYRLVDDRLVDDRLVDDRLVDDRLVDDRLIDDRRPTKDRKPCGF